MAINERDAKIIQAINDGKSDGEIAEMFDLKISSIRAMKYRFRKEGLLPECVRSKASKEELREIIRLHFDGVALKQIASDMNYDKEYVNYLIYNFKKKNNITGYAGQIKRNRRIMELHQAGLNNTEIAKVFDITPLAVSNILKGEIPTVSLNLDDMKF